MFKVIAPIAGLLALFATPVLSFEVNATRQEVNRALDKLTVGDLATGEVGIVQWPNWCVLNGVLFALADDRLDEKPGEYGLNYRVRREPGNMLSVEVSIGKSSSTTDWRDEVAQKAAAAYDCSLAQQFGRQSVIAIDTINGFADLKALLGR